MLAGVIFLIIQDCFVKKKVLLCTLFFLVFISCFGLSIILREKKHESLFTIINIDQISKLN